MNPNQPTGETFSEGSPTEESGETASIPLSVAGPNAAPGQTITLKVISVDTESGTVTVASAGESMEESEEGGSDSMASEFDQAPTPQSI